MPMTSGTQTTILPSGLELTAGRIDKLDLRGIPGYANGIGTTELSVNNAMIDLAEWSGTISIVSDSADDTNSSSKAARRVRVRGITTDGLEVQEQVALNGTTPVTTTNTYTFINQLRVDNVGSQASSNVGTITASVGGTTVAQIDPGKCLAFIGSFKCAGDLHAAYITSLLFNIVGSGVIYLTTRRGGRERLTRMSIPLNNTTTTYQLPNPFPLLPGEILEFRAVAFADTIIVNADCQIITESP
jgi:hypothetical protein